MKQATRKRVGELVAVSVCGGSQQTEKDTEIGTFYDKTVLYQL